MTTTENARQTLAELEATLAAATTRATELQVERRRLAFDANTGDEAARKRLDKLNALSATADLEIENIRFAVDEAKRRLAEAERVEAMAEARQNGLRAIEIAGRIAERGRRIDEAFAAARAELDAFAKDLDELHLLGVTHPRGEQFRVLGGLALATHLMGLPIKVERDHLAPRERKTFTELAAGWRDGVALLVSQRINKEAA